MIAYADYVESMRLASECIENDGVDRILAELAAFAFVKLCVPCGRRRLAAKCPSCGWKSEPFVHRNPMHIDRVLLALGRHTNEKHGG